MNGAAGVRDALARLPRVPLATLPTPLVEAPRLAAALNVRTLYLKRDDLTGLAMGGNKARQMEFFLGDARAAEADVLIAGGSFDQSNHARMAAAAARVAGLRSIIVIRPGGRHPGHQGNGLLTRLLADEWRVEPSLGEAPQDRIAEVAHRVATFERIADERRAAGERPYVLTGSSVPLGAMGYVQAGLELVQQLDDAGLGGATVVVASCGATQAGLEIVARNTGAFRVHGFAYMPTTGAGPGWVADLAGGGARLLDLPTEVSRDSVINDEAAAGPAYGALSDGRREAIALALRHEAVFLDPVYSATGMAGLILALREGRVDPAAPLVFVHTGGLPALFAYSEELLPS